jgi:3-deoxy-D-arabino-heptulosonate 7-phosphate (DAHP) synthase
VHPHPERALSDGAQSLNLQDFAAMMQDLPIAVEAPVRRAS